MVAISVTLNTENKHLFMNIQIWFRKTWNQYIPGIHMQGRSQPHGPGWARNPLSSFFLKFWSIYLIFPQTLLIFFLILVLRVGGSPTREGPGYATVHMIIMSNIYKGTSGTSLSNDINSKVMHKNTWKKKVKEIRIKPITKVSKIKQSEKKDTIGHNCQKRHTTCSAIQVKSKTSWQGNGKDQ